MGGTARGGVAEEHALTMRFEPRGKVSIFWTYASPVLAMLLTILGTGLVFCGARAGRPARRSSPSSSRRCVQAGGLSALAVKAAPLIMMGVGLSLCYRAKVWNIGAEGQFTLGAIFAGGFALAFPDAAGLAALSRHDARCGVIGGAAMAAPRGVAANPTSTSTKSSPA